MSVTPAVAEVLAALARAFERLGRRWYVFGAQAVLLYGRPRLTADIDVTLDLDLGELASLVEALRDESFEVRVEGGFGELAARTRVVPIFHRSLGIPVDVVLAGPAGPEREFLESAVRHEVAGIDVPVIAPEDLVASKILAGRPKDLEDAGSVLGEQAGRIDLDRVRRWLELFEGALSRSDLIPELERLARSGERLRRPREEPEEG